MRFERHYAGEKVWDAMMPGHPGFTMYCAFAGDWQFVISLDQLHGTWSASYQPRHVSKNIDNSAKQTESIMTAYHTKHRPTSFKTVKGQEQACSSLERVLKKGTSQAFLLSGPSGCGKTTLARIAASVAGVEAGDVIDVDAATNSGADETRKLQEIMSFRPIGGGEKRS
jgi:ABC-type glutathione transport system ATPase component